MNALLEAPCDQVVPSPTRSHTNPSGHILVVDGDISIREFDAEVLLRSGYQVDVAEDGAAGWEALRAHCYDLLITDNKMPKVSGVELVKKVRSAGMTLPVVLVSSAIPTADLSHDPSLLLAATLLKPFTIQELLGTVKKALSGGDSTRGRTKIYFPMPTEEVRQIAPASQWGINE